MTPDEILACKDVDLLSLPQLVLDMIATMQLVPVAQVFSKKPAFKKPAASNANSWRTAVLVAYKKTELKHDDPDYETVLGISNKVAAKTVISSVEVIKEIIKRRDQAFRMRIVTLLFERGVAMPFFSKLMANIFEILFKDVPVVKDDLEFSCSIENFTRMFDQTETVVFPESSDPLYGDKICAWAKKKDIRRGFGMFVTELHIRGLVDEDIIMSAINSSIDELRDMITKPTNKEVIENADQFVTFLFESTKVIATRFGKMHSIVKMVSTKCAEIYKIPKEETPCLGMRSRFKIDDITRLK